MRGPKIARLDHLAGSDGPKTVSIKGASLTTLSALGGPHAGIPSSKDAQASLEASWAAPSKAKKVSEAHFGESKVTIVGLF